MKNEYNSKFDKNIETFIQKRIEGKSFDDIAGELKVSKQTLIDWNKKGDVRNLINEGKAIKINSIVKTYKFDLMNRIKTYLELSERINSELKDRDLTVVNTESLLKMSISNDNRLKELLNKTIEIGTDPIEWGKDRDGYFNFEFDE